MHTNRPPRSQPGRTLASASASASHDVRQPAFAGPGRIDIILGDTVMPIHELAALREGDVLALDAGINDPVDILLDGRPIARGRLVVQGGELGVTLTQVLDTAPH